MHNPGDSSEKNTTIQVKKTEDFRLTGDAQSENWSKTEWIPLSQLRGSKTQQYDTKIKLLYSDTGFYILFQCKDQILSASFNTNFQKFWKEDVVEVFLWPDENNAAYFEYEISPLNFELPLLVSHEPSGITRWMPFNYQECNRQTRHQTSVEGGKKESNAFVTTWNAECYIPFHLLGPLNNNTPQLGSTWRANFYRIDYDNEDVKWWAWQAVKKSFHEYKNYGTLLFE